MSDDPLSQYVRYYEKIQENSRRRMEACLKLNDLEHSLYKVASVIGVVSAILVPSVWGIWGLSLASLMVAGARKIRHGIYRLELATWKETQEFIENNTRKQDGGATKD